MAAKNNLATTEIFFSLLAKNCDFILKASVDVLHVLIVNLFPYQSAIAIGFVLCSIFFPAHNAVFLSGITEKLPLVS